METGLCVVTAAARLRHILPWEGRGQEEEYGRGRRGVTRAGVAGEGGRGRGGSPGESGTSEPRPRFQAPWLESVPIAVSNNIDEKELARLAQQVGRVAQQEGLGLRRG